MASIFTPTLPGNFSAADLQKVCRICLFPKSNFHSVFENDIDKMLTLFSPTKVVQNDGYPHQICSKCFGDVKVAYHFKRQCEYSHNIVKSILKGLKQGRPNPVPKIIECNVCVTQFCSNSNLKRHLKNIHGIDWEINHSRNKRPSSANTTEPPFGLFGETIGKYEFSCQMCSQNFYNEEEFRSHVCHAGSPDVSYSSNTQNENEDNDDDHDMPSYDVQNQSELSNSYKANDTIDNENENRLNLQILAENNNTQNELSSEDVQQAEKVKILNYLALKQETKQNYTTINTNVKIKSERELAYEILKRHATPSSSEPKPKRIMVRNADGKFECVTCHKSFNRADHLRRHELTHSTEPKPYSCPMCAKTFSRPDYLKYHINGVHVNIRPYQCLLCKKWFTRNSDLTRHNKMCVAIKNEIKLEKDLEEPIIENLEPNTNVQNSLEDGSLGKNNLELSSGPMNNIKSDNTNLQNSLENISLEKYNLQTNSEPMNTVESDNTNVQNSLEDISLEKNNLELNSESMNNIKFDINSTDVTFESNQGINDITSESGSMDHSRGLLLSMLDADSSCEPILLRNNNGKFECEQCNREFNRKAHLQRHYLTHTKYKPYACDYCAGTFSCPEYLQTHVNRVHAFCNDSDDPDIYEPSQSQDEDTGVNSTFGEINNRVKIKAEVESEPELEPNNADNYPTSEHESISHPNEQSQLKINIKEEYRRESEFNERDYNNFESESHSQSESESQDIKLNKKLISYSRKPPVPRTPDGKYKCEICDKVYNRAEHVRRHELSHTDAPKPFSCNLCPKVFSRSDNLKKHLNTCFEKVMSTSNVSYEKVISTSDLT